MPYIYIIHIYRRSGGIEVLCEIAIANRYICCLLSCISMDVWTTKRKRYDMMPKHKYTKAYSLWKCSIHSIFAIKLNRIYYYYYYFFYWETQISYMYVHICSWMWEIFERSSDFLRCFAGLNWMLCWDMVKQKYIVVYIKTIDLEKLIKFSK